MQKQDNALAVKEGTPIPSTKAARHHVYIYYYDILNIFACLSVLVLHFNGLSHAYSQTAAYYQALGAECLFFWAVPVFLMLTGATLIDYRHRYSTRAFFKKRITKTFVPFIAWSFLALAWKVLTNQMEGPVGPRSLIDLIFNTKIIDVYWFFIPLFSIYLMIPILSLFVKNENFIQLKYIVCVYIMLNSILPLLFELIGIPFNGNLNISLMGGYLIFPVLGYYLANTQMSSRHRQILYILAIVATVLRYLIIVEYEGAPGSLAWSYLSPAGILQGAAVFVFIKQVDWPRLLSNTKGKQAIRRLSSCSFGIYLIHMIVFYYGLALTHLDGSSLIWRTLGPLVAYLVCLAIVLVGKSIPLVRRLFP